MPDIANLNNEDPTLMQSPWRAAALGAAKGMSGNRPMYGQMGGMAGSALGAFLNQRKKNNALANMNTTYGPSGGDRNMMPTAPMPGATDDSEDDGASLPMARGGIVSKPTKILAGENGPEAIIPLNNNPANKVSTSLLRRR